MKTQQTGKVAGTSAGAGELLGHLRNLKIANSSRKSSEMPRFTNNTEISTEQKGHITTPHVNHGLNYGSEELEERTRIGEVGRKKDLVHIEKINGRAINIVQGLELHTRVFNDEEQKKIVECVYKYQRMGQRGELRERTYSEPSKWMRGKGRVTIQFGCCYNYAMDKKGNPPGILRDEEVDPLPPVFKQMIKRMIRWNVLPQTCIPNSCIVNIYDEGDCIPPHVDHHDFLRPFCTVSFLAECKILFGANLKIVGPGEFDGPVSISLPVGSVLILNGNGADVAKHCIPGVPAKRISITFRKMDEKKLPRSYVPDPDLQTLTPLKFNFSSSMESPVHENYKTTHNQPWSREESGNSRHDNEKIIQNQPGSSGESENNSYVIEKDDFPPLGSLNSGNKQRNRRYSQRQ